MKHVYFMRPMGMAGPIKIGCSAQPQARLKSLDIWSPFPLELIAWAPGTHTDERRLHWRFRADQSHGEWFLASTALLDLIDHVRRNGTLPPLEAVPAKSATRKLRNLGWRRQKTALGKRLNDAEIRAWGWWGRAGKRPDFIQAIREKCKGAHQPPLAGADLAAIETYIGGLNELPCGTGSEADKAAKTALHARIFRRKQDAA